MKLIDKDAVVAEIMNCIDRCNIKKRYCPANTQVEAVCDNKIYAYKELLSCLDTLEVKNVDLEKIINDYFKDWKFDEELDIMVKPNNYSASLTDLKEIAKYFFELGLKVVQKGK